MDDALALEALLELSQNISEGKQCLRLDDKNFPLLDEPIVVSAVEAITFILEKKHKLAKQSIELLKKWSDVRDTGLSAHWTWIGRGLGRLDTLDCLLASCEVLLDQKSINTNWQCLELQQQQALCLSMISLSTESEKAKKLCVNLFEHFISHSVSIVDHEDFLDKFWDLRGNLNLTTQQSELLVQNFPFGLEKQLLRVARECIIKVPYEPDVWLRADNRTLIELCSSSPVIFQVATSILMQLVIKSQAHQNIYDLLSDFVRKCAPSEKEVVRLYPAKCQVTLALLSVPLEAAYSTNYLDYLVDALRDLQPSMANLLLFLNPKWIPFLIDKL